MDLKGSLKSLPEHGGLYEELREPEKARSEVAWNESRIELQQEDKCESKVDAVIEGNQGNLNENFSVWSDFLYSRFHPRTINVVREYEHGNEEKGFDVFPLGTELWRSEQFQEDFSDKIRQYLEECDNFQGFQILLDANNAFSGLTSACLEYLQDEYERKAVLALPLIPPHYSDYNFDTTEGECKSLIKDSLRVLNIALGFSSLAERSSLFVPLSVGSTGWRQPGPKRNFNHLIYDVSFATGRLIYLLIDFSLQHTSSFQSSAILATAIDTFSLQYRLKGGGYSLSDLCRDLSPQGRKLAAASVCLPFSINEGDYLLDCLDNWDGPLTRTITPNCSIGITCFLVL